MLRTLIILGLSGPLTWTGYLWISGVMEPGPAGVDTLCVGALFLALTFIVLPIAVLLIFEAWTQQLERHQNYDAMISDVKADLLPYLHRLVILYPNMGFNVGFSRKNMYVHIADPTDRRSIDFPNLTPKEKRNLLALMKKAKKKRHWFLQRLALDFAGTEIYLPPPSSHQILRALARMQDATKRSRHLADMVSMAGGLAIISRDLNKVN